MIYSMVMTRTKNNNGGIRIPANTNVWKHELHTARALAMAGYVVEFLLAKNIKNVKSPDIFMNGHKWEIKSPKTDRLSVVERNLKRATRQSHNVIIDSHRLRKLHDVTIQRFLVQKYKEQKTIKRLLFINRKRKIVDISMLV